jgi:hypothetical protein
LAQFFDSTDGKAEARMSIAYSETTVTTVGWSLPTSGTSTGMGATGESSTVKGRWYVGLEVELSARAECRVVFQWKAADRKSAGQLEGIESLEFHVAVWRVVSGMALSFGIFRKNHLQFAGG